MTTRKNRMWNSVAVAALGAGAILAAAVVVEPALAQTTISADGVVESKSGGFKFPDGTVQTTAAGVPDPCPTLDASDEMIQVGGVCIDKYEASIWNAPTGGSQIIGTTATHYCNPNGQDCDDIYARSVAGVEPAANITWFQAQQALANSGKRLPTNAEWQMAVRGTPDDTTCNVVSGSVANTGAHLGCVSDWGAIDMVGNLWEWVADWGDRAVGCTNYSSFFGNDASCVGLGEGEVNNHFPSALLRGGYFDDGPLLAGPLAVNGLFEPAASLSLIGFRGAR